MTKRTKKNKDLHEESRRPRISAVLDAEFCARYPELAAHIATKRRQRIKRRRLLWRWPLAGIVTAVAASLMLVGPVAQAQEAADDETQYVGINEAQTGSLLFRTDVRGRYVPAPRLDTDVEMRISGMVASVTVRQHFENRGAGWVEGVYVFPLPENAAVNALRMRIGERLIEGEIRERAEARRKYEKAKAAGKRASLIEQQRPNLFTNSVANIGPGETVEIEITYLQTLVYQQGRFSLRFPMTLTPRFIPGRPLGEDAGPVRVTGNGWSQDTDAVPDASRITPSMAVGAIRADGSIRNSASLRVTLDAGLPLAHVASLYHDCHVSRDNEVYRVEFAEGRVPMDRDFELTWRPAVGADPAAAVFSETVAHEDYALVMLMPPQVRTGSGQGTRLVTPREFVLVIDTSGSMKGDSIEQARAALLMALRRLTPDDRFNIIEFNSNSRALFAGAVPATPDMLAQAEAWVRRLNASGGTHMLPALERALLGVPPTGYLRQVVFVTDGSVGNEDQLFEVIRQDLRDARLFTVGIGSAPNSHFMNKAAQFGRGTYTFISKQQEVRERMLALFEKLERPVLTDLEIEWPGGGHPEAWPQRLPDLYAGEPVVVTVRNASLNGDLKLSGVTGGRAWTRTLQLSSGEAHEGVAALWARNKIAALMDGLVEGRPKAEVRKEVISVALTHRLVSKFTSLVAVDRTPARPPDATLGARGVRNLMPKGSDYGAIFGNYPATATVSRLNFLIGLALLLVSLLFWRLPALGARP